MNKLNKFILKYSLTPGESIKDTCSLYSSLLFGYLVLGFLLSTVSVYLWGLGGILLHEKFVLADLFSYFDTYPSPNGSTELLMSAVSMLHFLLLAVLMTLCAYGIVFYVVEKMVGHIGQAWVGLGFNKVIERIKDKFCRPLTEAERLSLGE